MSRLALASQLIQQKLMKWPDQPLAMKIDTHHHYVPDFYAKAVKDAGGDPSGWPTPAWSARASKTMMLRLGVSTAILSITAPGACVKRGEPSYLLARELNNFGSSLRDQDPDHFGFFASLPSLLDTHAALAEIEYAFDTLRADGVTLFTRYGEGNTYLGHAALEPIWMELHRRNAVVFVHPTHPKDTIKVNSKMPQPVIDYPHETTRAAMDMILMGTRRKYPNCKVILSHAGGALPYLIGRLATPLRKVPNLVASLAMGTDHDKAWEDFRSFYYDLALSSTTPVLRMILDVIPHDNILFGSDYPYAPTPAYPAFLEDLEGFDIPDELRDKINFKNALALFPRLMKPKHDHQL